MDKKIASIFHSAISLHRTIGAMIASMTDNDDPIYAVIQVHQASAAAFGTTPSDHAAAAEFAALDLLTRTEPRTIAGVIALLRYTQDLEHNDLPDGFDRELRRSLWRALTRIYPA